MDKNKNKTKNLVELQYAAEVGLFEAYRYGSDKFFEMFVLARQYQDSIEFLAEDLYWIEETEIGTFAEYEGKRVPLDLPILDDFEDAKSSDVKLNQVQKGGSKRFFVYVKNSKGNVVKVSFGTSGVTRDKLEDPERRNAFAARHNCESANDKTTPRYWACRAPAWWHKVMGGSKINARWW